MCVSDENFIRVMYYNTIYIYTSRAAHIYYFILKSCHSCIIMYYTLYTEKQTWNAVKKQKKKKMTIPLELKFSNHFYKKKFLSNFQFSTTFRK